ncbi:two-component system, NarL family, sensor histidine kinase DesK [Nonomuraea solani]|uniref:Two-component system, NarL family, sensor histidine kinase DesK n=1 Tax=Nonomuraea solani TaxID=1144553 RepID=A0A1H6BBN8_9ACTN|nr:sensor histidine kinase [Nonomuraea solani]SEG58060.1 two-component system, NarL family, sensor histidine kinase DesK [Nonomuraea solani]
MDAITRARRFTWKMLLSNIVMLWLVILFQTGAAIEVGRLYWWSAGPALIAAVLFTWLFPKMVNAALDRRYPTRMVVVAAVLAVVGTGVGGGETIGYGFMLICWLAVATLNIPRRMSFLLSGLTFVVGVGFGALSAVIGTSVMAAEMGLQASMIYYAIIYGFFCGIMPPSTRMSVWIWMLAEEAHEGREAHTRLALAEERLRFARDLHDLVGHQLSAIAVKTELATRLSDVDIDAAQAEMAEVNRLTRKALKELRQAVRGYRELDLTAELNSVKGVLEAAGVRCEVGIPYRELPAGVGPVFAYVVREAVTNVLKHSTASFCEITIRFTEQEAELRVHNDGVTRPQEADLGTGLTGMRERLASLGGRLTAHPTAGGQFLLNAVVSLPLGG